MENSEISRKNVVFTTQGEFYRETQGWKDWFEESLSKAFVCLSRGANESVLLAVIFMVWSFAQLAILLYDKELNFPLRGNEYSMVYSILMTLKISGIPGEYGGGTAFLAIGYLCSMVPILALIFLVLIVKNPTIKYPNTHRFVKATNILLQFVYWILFIPLIDFCIVLLNNNYLEIKTGLDFSYSSITVHRIVFILLSFVVVFLSLAQALFGFNTNPFISDPLSRYQWNFEIFYLFLIELVLTLFPGGINYFDVQIL